MADNVGEQVRRLVARESALVTELADVRAELEAVRSALMTVAPVERTKLDDYRGIVRQALLKFPNGAPTATVVSVTTRPDGTDWKAWRNRIYWAMKKMAQAGEVIHDQKNHLWIPAGLQAENRADLVAAAVDEAATAVPAEVPMPAPVKKRGGGRRKAQDGQPKPEVVHDAAPVMQPEPESVQTVPTAPCRRP